jgi:hypothetical protein
MMATRAATGTCDTVDVGEVLGWRSVNLLEGESRVDCGLVASVFPQG